MRILFVGAGRRRSLFRRFKAAGRKENVEIDLYSYELSDFVPVAKLATIITGFEWDAPEFKEDILNLVRDNKISLIIPMMDPAVSKISTYVRQFREMNCWPAVSRHDICLTFNDKQSAQTWFIEHNVQTPVYRFQKTHGKLIVKPRWGFGGRGIKIIEPSEFKLWDDGQVLIQPFIEHITEFSIDAYVSQKGEILGCVTRKRMRVADGEVINSITENKPALEAEARRIIAEAGFRGPVTLQAIEQNGDIYFIDVNVRFGGGVILSIEAGADYPRLLIREVLGRKVEPVTWAPNLLMTRSHEEAFFDCNV